MTSDDFDQEIGFLWFLHLNLKYYCNSVLSVLTLYRYRHPHIVQIMGMCSEPPFRAIVMEKMENGSLYNHLHEIHKTTPFLAVSM